MTIRSLLAAAALTAALCPSVSLAQKAFPTAQAASDAFVDALATNDRDAMRTVLGADYQKFVPAGIESDDVTKFLYYWAKGHKIAEDSADRAHLVIGDGWVLPIPIVKSKTGWAFDIKAGAEEMRTRRIGRNELAAMQAMLAFYDAEKEYADIDRNGDGVLEYAQRFLSTPGRKDGLYWPADGGPESPIGPRYAAATKDGIYHGYRFRILTAQGPAARGGARDFVVKGRMTNGFAAIAWPAKYGDTGVMTFIVSHDGAVYQKDLGAGTDAAARAITRFDPDKSWTRVEVPPPQ